MVDDAGLEHVGDVLLVRLPRVELEGQARGRQLLEHHRAVRGVPGVRPTPERGGGAERLEVRNVGEQCIEDREHLVPGVDADVDVDAEDEHVPAPPLGATDEFEVPVLRSDLLHLPLCEGVGACRHELDPAGLGERAQRPHRGREVIGDVGDCGVDTGDEFDRVRKHLADDPLLELGSAFGDVGEEGLRCGREIQALTVEQSEFPFDTDGGTGGVSEIDHGPILVGQGAWSVRGLRRRTCFAPTSMGACQLACA